MIYAEFNLKNAWRICLYQKLYGLWFTSLAFTSNPLYVIDDPQLHGFYSVRSQSWQVWWVTWADICYSSKTPETAVASFPAVCMYFYIVLCLVSSIAGPSNSNAYAHTYLSPLMRPALWSNTHYSTPSNKCGCVCVFGGVYTVCEWVYVCVWQTNGTGQSSSIPCCSGDM